MKFWALLIMGAVSPFLFVSTLPTQAALLALPLVAMCGLKSNRRLRVYCLLPLLFLISTLAINQRIAERLPISANKTELELDGVVGSLPEITADGVRFLFIPDRPGAEVPEKIQIYWYKNRHAPSNVPPIHAGERWRLRLVLRVVRGRVNFHGADLERWYFTEGIGALGQVRDAGSTRLSGPSRFDLQHWRENLLEKLAERAGERPAFRLLAALAIADRRGILGRDRAILSATGTGHLLAISGLHIGLAAAMGYYLGRMALLLLSTGLKLRLAIALPWAAAWLAAAMYTALSGFGVSTQRALIMLTVAALAFLSRRSIQPLQAWLIAMSLVLVADPVAPLRAGFWFSFIAVGVLLMLFVPRFGRMPAWRKMLLAQVGISLVMAPLGMHWFQQASLPGLIANLFAIPVVSLLIVPSVLAAMLLVWLPGPVAGWVLGFAAQLAHWLMLTLERLSTLQPAGFSSTTAPAMAAAILAMLGAAVVMLPRGTPGRAAGLLLMLPLLLPEQTARSAGERQVDFLDVGQGLSIVVATEKHLLLYDTGPGNGVAGEGGRDMVESTIQPAIVATGLSPDMVVASHADLDHAGGLDRLVSVFPSATYLANLPKGRKGVGACVAAGRWSWDGLQFRILHPSPGLPYLGNDSSCVIAVTGPGLNLLLAGDISRVVERRLLQEGLGSYAILSVPHHGSATSSSQPMLDAVKPALAVVSSAFGNRFGFPRGEVLDRYDRARIPVLNTAQCGGIRIVSRQEGDMVIRSARAHRKAIWRWPADPACP